MAALPLKRGGGSGAALGAAAAALLDDDSEAKPLIHRAGAAAAVAGYKDPDAPLSLRHHSGTPGVLPGGAVAVGGGGAMGGAGGGGGGLTVVGHMDAACVAAATEASCLRKLNRRVLSLLFAVAMMCYIDRTNLAFASVSMTADLGFNAQVYGLGSGLFFLGYSLTMVPVQLILLRVGAPKALGCIVAAWGATAMAFSTLAGECQFYALRLLLGVSESGAFPAIWFYINSWFPPSAQTLSYSVIEAAVGAANCIAAPLAAALLLMDGFMGLRGWQILFFVEGLPSVLLGLLIWRCLPRHVHDAKFLSPAERAWIGAAAASGRKAAEQGEALGAARVLREALSNGRLWVIMLVGILKNAALNGVLFFAPKLVDSIMSGSAVDVDSSSSAAAAGRARGGLRLISSGRGGGGGGGRALLAAGAAAPATAAGVRAALLTSVPFVLAAAGAVWLGKRTQERGERCRHIAVCWFVSAAAFVAFPHAASASPQAGFACLTLAVVAATSPNALLNTLASAVSQGPAQAVALSVYNAVANVGGLLGPLFIGFMVHHTGVYSGAMVGLGVLVAVSGLVVWQTQRWGIS